MFFPPMECHFIICIFIYTQNMLSSLSHAIKSYSKNFYLQLLKSTGHFCTSNGYLRKKNSLFFSFETFIETLTIQNPYHIWWWLLHLSTCLLYCFHIFEDWKFLQRASKFSSHGVVGCKDRESKFDFVALSWAR